jgi:hypothetical protein
MNLRKWFKENQAPPKSRSPRSSNRNRPRCHGLMVLCPDGYPHHVVGSRLLVTCNPNGCILETETTETILDRIDLWSSCGLDDASNTYTA